MTQILYHIICVSVDKWAELNNMSIQSLTSFSYISHTPWDICGIVRFERMNIAERTQSKKYECTAYVRAVTAYSLDRKICNVPCSHSSTYYIIQHYYINIIKVKYWNAWKKNRYEMKWNILVNTCRYLHLCRVEGSNDENSCLLSESSSWSLTKFSGRQIKRKNRWISAKKRGVNFSFNKWMISYACISISYETKL